MKKIYLIIVLAICFADGTLAQTLFIKYDEPIMEPEADAWDKGSIAMPMVLKLDGTYHMWYSGGSWDTPGLQIGHATSADGINWEFDANNPVIQLGEQGSFDDFHAYLPNVEYDGSIFHMYYVGGNNDGTYTEHLGYATSEDGSSWTKHPDKLVYKYANGDPFPGSATHGDVYYDGDKFHMWTGMRGQEYNVWYAHSEDGYTWVVRDSLVMEHGVLGDWFFPRTQVATVIKYEHPEITGKYHMWYSGGQFKNWDIGYAYSDDGLNWTRYGDGPVLEQGESGDWDASFVCFPSVIITEEDDRSRFIMWYGGMSENYGLIGYAVTPPVNVSNFTTGNSMTVYPNPANGWIVLETEFPGSKIMKLYNISGQVICQSILKNASTRIDVSSYKKGIYFVVVTNGQNTATRKLLIE